MIARKGWDPLFTDEFRGVLAAWGVTCSGPARIGTPQIRRLPVLLVDGRLEVTNGPPVEDGEPDDCHSGGPP
jgi:hypothetical protein